MIAADLIAAAKAGDHASLADAQSRWETNAGQIALPSDLLSDGIVKQFPRRFR